MHIVPVTDKDYQQAVGLLNENNLPTTDLTHTTLLYALYDDQQLIGTVGLEIFGHEGLLRSLCVDNQVRKAGYGQLLVSYVEEEAKQKGLTVLYLLTTTADAFFANRGYQTIDRSAVPENIQQTQQFSTICSKTATLMKKELV